MVARSHHQLMFAAVLLVLAAYLMAFAALMRQREDISWFVVAGGPGVDPAQIPAGLSIIPGIEGYDGMAFYRLALDPFTRQAKDFGITLDTPPYRQQRILYPLLVHVLSFGRAEWVPTLLVVVNLIAVICLAVGAAAIAAQYGLNPLWGVLVPLYPGFFIAFSRDTSEIVAWAFAVLAIRALGARQWGLGTALICAAVLSRETTLILAAGMAAVYTWQWVSRRQRSFPAIVFALPTVVYGAWQLVLRSWWGISGLEAGALKAAVPFSEYARLFVESAPRRTVLMRVHFAECVFWAVVVCAVAFVIVRTTAAPQWRVAWTVSLGLAAILGRDVWSEQASFMRVLSDLYVPSAIILLGASPPARWLVLLASCSLSFYVMSHMR